MTTTEIADYLDFFEDKVVPEHQFPSREHLSFCSIAFID